MDTLTQYGKHTDEELIALSRKGESACEEILCRRYKNMVRNKAKTLFLMGGDKDDLNQEGMIGLIKAARAFDPEKNDCFASFAALCIDRQMYTAIESSRRQKNAPLNSYIPLQNEEESGEISGEVALAGRAFEPESVYLDKEAADRLKTRIMEILSPLERRVFEMYSAGEDYTEIAVKLHKSPKSIDNAIQRIRQKARRMLGQRS